MRKVALGLVGVVACAGALVSIQVSMIDSPSLTGCGPLANDPSEDAAAGGGSSSGGGAGSSSGGSGADSGTPSGGDSGSGSRDSGASGGHDGGGQDSGENGGDDAGGEDAPQSGDDAPQAQCTPVTTWTSGNGIKNTTWSATASANPNDVVDVVTQAFDDKIATRWSTGAAQTPAADQYFTLNLGSVQSFDQVALFYPLAGDAGTTDYPAEYTIGVSNSESGPFTIVATGAGASPTVSCFTTQSAQFIQVSQTGTSPTAAWFSIYEIQVFSN